MILESIQLQNYRQYVDANISFSVPSDGKTFTIIQGANGCGKTNLLNAITWCLYGEEKHMDEKKRGLPLVSMPTAQKMDPGDIAEVKVEIQMLDEDDNQVIFTRSLSYRKSDDGELRIVPDTLSSSKDGSTFEMMREINKEMVIVQTPNYILNRMIPESLEEYFFFDGERLNTYFKESKGKIRDEVFKISQMDLLETTLNHLKSKRQDFFRESGKFSSEAEKIGENIKILTKSCDDQIKLLNQDRQEKEEAEKEEAELKNKLANCNVEYISQRQKMRDDLEQELDKIDNDLEEINSRKLDYLIKTTPSIFLSDSIAKAIELISEREEAGDIPSDYKRQFIQKLLDKGECICGTDISSDNSFRKSVTVYFDQCEHISDISEEILKLNVTLNSILSSAKKFNNSDFNDYIRKWELEKKEKSETLHELSEEIDNYQDYETAIVWNQQLKELMGMRKNIDREIIRKELLIESSQNKIEQLNKDLDKELAKEKEYDEIRKILQFCEISLNQITTIKSEIMDEFRKELEQKTEEQFFELIWKKDNYKQVTISDDYDLSVIHQSGWEAINTLSAGERQVLALSFMAALNNVSGFDVPIIIDTPLGRISKEPKLNIAKNLPNYLSGKQTILLVTEEEYTSGVRDRLLDRVGKEYRIVFEDRKDGAFSRVMPYAE